jgi:hypothetical protein
MPCGDKLRLLPWQNHGTSVRRRPDVGVALALTPTLQRRSQTETRYSERRRRISMGAPRLADVYADAAAGDPRQAPLRSHSNHSPSAAWPVTSSAGADEGTPARTGPGFLHRAI